MKCPKNARMNMAVEINIIRTFVYCRNTRMIVYLRYKFYVEEKRLDEEHYTNLNSFEYIIPPTYCKL